MAHSKLSALYRGLITAGTTALLLSASLAAFGHTGDHSLGVPELDSESLLPELLDEADEAVAEAEEAALEAAADLVPAPVPAPEAAPPPEAVAPDPGVAEPREMSPAGGDVRPLGGGAARPAEAAPATAPSGGAPVTAYSEAGPFRNGYRSQDGLFFQPVPVPLVSGPVVELAPQVAEALSAAVPAAVRAAEAAPIGGLVPRGVPGWLLVTGGALLFVVAAAQVLESRGLLGASYVRRS